LCSVPFCIRCVELFEYPEVTVGAGARGNEPYCSIAGWTSDLQHELIRAAIASMPTASEIVAAPDADNGGHAVMVREAFELAVRRAW